jgi:hypothetical protein
VESDHTVGPGKLMLTIPQVDQLARRFGQDGKVGRQITCSSPWGRNNSGNTVRDLLWCRLFFPQKFENAPCPPFECVAFSRDVLCFADINVVFWELTDYQGRTDSNVVGMANQPP